MDESFSRTQLLLGTRAMDRLQNACIAVFGIGGVGGHCSEALARSGVGTLHLFDDDRVSVSNLNRQIVALRSTVGRYKVDVMRDRILDINPSAHVAANRIFYTPQCADYVDLSQYDYIVDCIDTITAKLELIERASSAGVPIISSMGTAHKMDPTALRVMDLYDTSFCPLARIMRKELRKRGIQRLKVVSSLEPPLPYAHDASVSAEADHPTDSDRPGKQASRPTPASNAFVPASAGLLLASVVVRDLTNQAKKP